MNVQEFYERYPVFSNLDESVIESELVFATNFVSVGSESYDYLLGLIVAHSLELELRNQLAHGSTLRQTEVGIGINAGYLVEKASDKKDSNSYWKQTIYGQKYLQLTAQSGTAIFVA